MMLPITWIAESGPLRAISIGTQHPRPPVLLVFPPASPSFYGLAVVGDVIGLVSICFGFLLFDARGECSSHYDFALFPDQGLDLDLPGPGFLDPRGRGI